MEIEDGVAPNTVHMMVGGEKRIEPAGRARTFHGMGQANFSKSKQGAVNRVEG